VSLQTAVAMVMSHVTAKPALPVILRWSKRLSEAAHALFQMPQAALKTILRVKSHITFGEPVNSHDFAKASVQ